EPDRCEHAEHNRADAGDRSDDRARLECPPEIGIDEELVVPVEREAAERERRHVGGVEREDHQDHDRRLEEAIYEPEQRPAENRAVLGECDVHQSAATCWGCRNRAKTTVSTATTRSRKIASTDPVSQSGKPVPNRSTIWLPYM